MVQCMTNVGMEAHSMDLDQTAPVSKVFNQDASKNIQQMTKVNDIFVIGALRVMCWLEIYEP